MGMDGLSGQGQSPMNMGGSWNPSYASGASGQSNQGIYGIQPPRLSNPFDVGSLGVSANRSTNPYQQSAQVYSPGPDTSAQHQANVAMAQSGFGNVGLQGYRGFPGEVQGTSASNYGISPMGWADVNAYMVNPMGTWQAPTGSTMGQYGDVGTDNNSNRYQMMIDSIKSSLSGQWPDMSWLNNFPGAEAYGQSTGLGQSPHQDANGNWVSTPQGAWNGMTQLGGDYANTAAADLLQRFGSQYGALPGTQTQSIGIPTTSLPGVRSY